MSLRSGVFRIITLFSATGCARCKVIRSFLEERGLDFQEHDALGEGREAFKVFYQQNRPKVHRGPDGIEFPLYVDGEMIRQGIAAVLGHLVGGRVLEGFFKPGLLHGEWVDGIDVSGGDPASGERISDVLQILKSRGFKVQIETNGVNANLLQALLERKLADRVVMALKGPLRLYASILQREVDQEEIKKSIALTATCEDHLFVTPIAPIAREPGPPAKLSYLTPEEVEEVARLIKEVTGDHTQPYGLCRFDPKSAVDEGLKAFEALPPQALFLYRSKARRHQVRTDIVN